MENENGKGFEESVLIDLRQNVTKWYREEFGDKAWTPPSKPDELWDKILKCYDKKTTSLIDIDKIEVYDMVQRTREDILRSPVFRKMEAEFDPQLFEPCKLAKFKDDNGVVHYINVDGQGRQIFAIIHGFRYMPCSVILVKDWDEVKSLFFKFNNENRFEHLKKSCKWDVLRKQGDKDVEDDMKQILSYFSDIEMPGRKLNSDSKSGLFSEKDFHDYFRFTTFFRKHGGGYECKDLKMKRKLLLKPYSIIRKGLNQDIGFSNWSTILCTICMAIKRFDSVNYESTFDDLFVNAPNPLPLYPKLGMSNKQDLDDFYRSLFIKPSKNGLLKEELALRLLALCKKCKMINGTFLKSKLGEPSVYENIVSELKELKKTR